MTDVARSSGRHAGTLVVVARNHPFVPLRHRDVRRLWTAAFISDVGTWVQLIVVSTLVARDTGSALQTGLVALATFMPQGLAAPVGGLLADRHDRRRVFASALSAQAVVTGVLAVVLATGVRTPSILTVLILLSSLMGALGQPSYAAMLPDLVPPEELVAILSLGVFSWNGGRVVGPVLASLLAFALGPAWTVAFNSATFLVMAIAVAGLRRSFQPPGGDGGIVERLRDGWRATRSTPGCWYGVRLLVLYSITAVGFMGLVPFYATDVFGGNTGLAGTLASLQGIGAILGGVAVTSLVARHRRSAVLVGVTVSLCVSLTLFAIAPTRPTAMVAIFVLGAAATAMFLNTTSIVQRDAPASRRGRVLSLQQGAGGTSYGLGLVFLGGLGDLTSIRVAFVVGALLMAVGFVVLNVRTGHWREAVNGEMAPPTEEWLTSEPHRTGLRKLIFGPGQEVSQDLYGS